MCQIFEELGEIKKNSFIPSVFGGAKYKNTTTVSNKLSNSTVINNKTHDVSKKQQINFL